MQTRETKESHKNKEMQKEIMVLHGVTSKASMLLIGEKTPKKRGILPTVASGVGVDQTARAIDRLVGSPLQRFAGFNVPFLGNVGIIDALNFLIFFVQIFLLQVPVLNNRL